MFIFYENANKKIYFECGEFCIHTQSPFLAYIISYKDFIEEINALTDKTEAWKRLTIIQAGKTAGILEEIA